MFQFGAGENSICNNVVRVCVQRDGFDMRAFAGFGFILDGGMDEKAQQFIICYQFDRPSNPAKTRTCD
jgi:hypothetical protein